MRTEVKNLLEENPALSNLPLLLRTRTCCILPVKSFTSGLVCTWPSTQFTWDTTVFSFLMLVPFEDPLLKNIA